MNDRLRQLAEQSEVLFEDGEYLDSDIKRLEKFAELIIKETLQVARAGIEYGPSMEEAVYTYFGVEE